MQVRKRAGFGLTSMIIWVSKVLYGRVGKARGSNILSPHALVLKILWCYDLSFTIICLATHMIDVFSDLSAIFSGFS